MTINNAAGRAASTPSAPSRTASTASGGTDAPPGFFLTKRQAAELFAVTPHLLAALRAEQRGPAHYRGPDGSTTYYRDDVLAWAI